MKKKWIKRGFLLGVLLSLVYLFIEFFLMDYLAERRYLKDKQEMITNLNKNREVFDFIRISSNSLPNYELSMKEKGRIILWIHLDNSETLTDSSRLSNYHYLHFPSFTQGAIDTFINETKWSIYINNAENDSTFFNGMKLFKQNQNQFLKISESAEKIGSTYILNSKTHWLTILYKETYCEGLRYVSPNFDLAQIPEQDISSTIGEKIDDHFYCDLFSQNDLLYCDTPRKWIIPE